MNDRHDPSTGSLERPPLEPEVRTSPLELRRLARRAEGRRMLVGAVLSVLVAFALGAGLWVWTQNLGLAASICGILLVLLPGVGAAITRGRRRR
jgi:hypothetical protein